MQTGKDWAVITGKLLSTMSEKEWDALLEKPYIIFARTTPEETLFIVEACQARNEIIALIAGSVNEADSLAKANIGIASNKTSTDIAIKAADIVLNEDSLSTIVEGIKVNLFI
jgi:sodium/potassium-transporting ATPase subunit alpha